MTYIILAAGKGQRLTPLTLYTPKCLYKLDRDVTVLKKIIKSIRKFDEESEIVVVAGHMFEQVYKELENENIILIRNPFYAITNSIVSLWFAREYLNRKNVTILNGDMVLSDKFVADVLIKETCIPLILVDSKSCKLNKYSVQFQNNRICIMSKELNKYDAQYISATKLDQVSSLFLKEEIEIMVNDELYNHLYEDALIQLIFSNDFELYYKDINGYDYNEIDTLDDLMKARSVHKKDLGEK